jgi:hypothetical protein
MIEPFIVQDQELIMHDTRIDNSDLRDQQNIFFGLNSVLNIAATIMLHH